MYLNQFSYLFIGTTTKEPPWDSGDSNQRLNQSPNSANTHPSQGQHVKDRKERLQWPRATEKENQAQFDIDVDTVLENMLEGGIDRKLEAFSVIIYNMEWETLGAQSEKVGPAGIKQPGRREQGSEQ